MGHVRAVILASRCYGQAHLRTLPVKQPTTTMDDDEDGQAFAIPDWWKTSSFTLGDPQMEPTLFRVVDFDGMISRRVAFTRHQRD